MPSIECHCPECGYNFNRIFFRGDENKSVICPKCQCDKVKYSKSNPGLFDGISNFSSLAKDTN